MALITTGTDLKRTRERLGLSQSQVAKRIGVANRTYQVWEEGMTLSIPNKGKLELENLARRASIKTWKTLLQINDYIMNSNDTGRIVLFYYQKDEDLHRYESDLQDMPASYYNKAVLDRMTRELKLEDLEVHTIYMAPDDYERWRKRKGREDSLETRLDWAKEDYIRRFTGK